jgi:hypothetical protein
MKTKICTIIIAACFAAALAACAPAKGGTAVGSPEIHRIDQIVDGPIQVTNFRPDGTATLPVHTNVPVACSVVYGTTPQFGSLTLDLDMAGAAHSDHNPLLSGLKPQTKYYFRMQGTDASGNIYVSDVLTFTTPPASTSEVKNLASPQMGAVIDGYSSAYGNAAPDQTWGASGAFDDNPGTAWASAGDGSKAWITVRLAKPAQITGLSFQSRSMSDGSAITQEFTVTTESGKVYGPFKVTDPSKLSTFDVAFEGQTLRFDLDQTTGGNTGAVDIAVYGDFLK